MLAGLASALSVATVAGAQTGAGAATPAAPASKAAPTAPPLQLNSLDPSSRPDPFPPVNPKYFTASSPTVDTVNSFLKTLWGYDPNRIWRVEAIQTTSAPGVSKVIVFVSDKSPNAKVQTTAFFVTPDGKHAIADSSGVIPFGATPFAETRKLLQDRADGATKGAAGKDLLLVEFSDLQCPHCKDAQGMMDQLAKDFPNARIIYQSFPLVEIHPFAFKAAAYGYCIQKQKNDAFFPFATAVFETQAALTPETGDATLKSAVTKAGLDPAAIDTCAATQAVKDQVNASIKLAQDSGVDQTPMLAVNGHLLPMTQIPYETLKTIVAYQASLDGVSTGAAPAPALSKPPTLGK
ncbi:MAG: oxidoreductase [Edaphobacter sp.]|nr:oxidoreductase [Edaphobacter sp.]